MKNNLKKKYLESCLKKYKDDPKILWMEIQQFWPGKKSGNVRVGNVNGATSDIERANILNTHFVNTGDRIQATMSNANIDHTAFQRKILAPTF